MAASKCCIRSCGSTSSSPSCRSICSTTARECALHCFLPTHVRSAPIPFLIGIHESFLGTVARMPLDEHVFVNLDMNIVRSPFNDLDAIPSDLVCPVPALPKMTVSGSGSRSNPLSRSRRAPSTTRLPVPLWTSSSPPWAASPTICARCPAASTCLTRPASPHKASSAKVRPVLPLTSITSLQHTSHSSASCCRHSTLHSSSSTSCRSPTTRSP